MQGSMHAARVAPHLALRATLQLNPPRGRSAGGASSLGSAIEPDELPRRNPRPRSPPQLCVGKRTGIERGGRVCMDFLVLKPGKMYIYRSSVVDAGDGSAGGSSQEPRKRRADR
jgi:hypothetical protein